MPEGPLDTSWLQAMGWKEGQGLGANKDGIAAPISASSGPKQASDKGGLGNVVSHAHPCQLST